MFLQIFLINEVWTGFLLSGVFDGSNSGYISAYLSFWRAQLLFGLFRKQSRFPTKVILCPVVGVEEKEVVEEDQVDLRVWFWTTIGLCVKVSLYPV